MFSLEARLYSQCSGGRGKQTCEFQSSLVDIVSSKASQNYIMIDRLKKKLYIIYNKLYTINKYIFPSVYTWNPGQCQMSLFYCSTPHF